MCRDLNGVKKSGFECLGRGNSKQKERLLTSAEHDRAASLAGFELGIVLGQENGIKCDSGRWEPDLVGPKKEFRFYSECYCLPRRSLSRIIM